MAKQNQEEKHFLNLTGEYGVCSELAKHKVHASITLGNHKATDIIIIKDNKAWRIEVKTTNKNQFPTRFFQNYPTPETEPKPDFWVLVHIDSKTFASDFYVLTHEQMADEQMKRNKTTEWKPQGIVDNILLSDLEQYKNKWDTIIEQM